MTTLLFQSKYEDVRGRHIWCQLVPQVILIICCFTIVYIQNILKSVRHSVFIVNFLWCTFSHSQDFEKTGADAEILEGVANTIPLDILLAQLVKLRITIHITFCSDLSRKPLGRSHGSNLEEGWKHQ